ncbi:MAG TPA: hypothetical protein VHO69_12605 [Phototrophicaceae bacterium]|nr:hypothetical protein [Phototrophicaceae bacterium]
MPIHISWANDEKTILMETYEGRWTIEEYYQLIDDAAALLAETPHIVHIIGDATHSSIPPSQILMGIQYAIKKLPPNQGLTIFVKLSRVMRMFVDVGRQISPKIAQTTYAVDNLEEAHDLIARKGHTIQPG